MSCCRWCKSCCCYKCRLLVQTLLLWKCYCGKCCHCCKFCHCYECLYCWKCWCRCKCCFKYCKHCCYCKCCCSKLWWARRGSTFLLQKLSKLWKQTCSRTFNQALPHDWVLFQNSLSMYRHLPIAYTYLELGLKFQRNQRNVYISQKSVNVVRCHKSEQAQDKTAHFCLRFFVLNACFSQVFFFCGFDMPIKMI